MMAGTWRKRKLYVDNKAVGFSRLGRGTGKVWVNNMGCSGSES